MVLLARSTIPTLAAPIPPALKDCSKRFVRETAGLADADMLQQQTVVVSAEESVKGREAVILFCLSASCPIARSM